MQLFSSSVFPCTAGGQESGREAVEAKPLPLLCIQSCTPAPAGPTGPLRPQDQQQPTFRSLPILLLPAANIPQPPSEDFGGRI